jgi:hypothetical protein
LPQEIEGMRKSVEMDLGKRIDPVVGGGEATQGGHKAAFPQDKFLGVLYSTLSIFRNVSDT